VRFHASAGKCRPNISIKGPQGILLEGEVTPDWTSKEYEFKSGDRVSFSVFAQNCVREPTCKLTMGDTAAALPELRRRTSRGSSAPRGDM
jgi:hypothetical protein